MLHAGLSTVWLGILVIGMLVILIWQVWWPLPMTNSSFTVAPQRRRWLPACLTHTKPWMISLVRWLVLCVFILIVITGLVGTQIPQRSLATVLTWSVWWTVVVIVVWFAGTAWCAVCPWDSLANLIVRGRIWMRGKYHLGLSLRLPRPWRNLWPATIMLVGLSALELGLDLTNKPHATAQLALLVTALAITAMVLYERKAFCQYLCPIGRTLGAYSQLSPAGLTVKQTQICDACQSLDCYHGRGDFPACPTHLVIGRSHDHALCTSCGACVYSCRLQNVAFAFKSPHLLNTRRDMRRDEAWFVFMLLVLAGFHGVTMLPLWETWQAAWWAWLGHRSASMISFGVGLAVFLILLVTPYGLAVKFIGAGRQRKSAFAHWMWVLLPLAFAFHIAHNLGHINTEWQGLSDTLGNPFSRDALPLTITELHARHRGGLLPQNLIYGLQSLIMLGGYYYTIKVLKHIAHQKSTNMYRTTTWPIGIYVSAVMSLFVWMLSQPMVMRVA